MIGRRIAIGWATLAGMVLLWFALTTWTGIVSAGRFPSPADFWFSLVQITTLGYAGGVLFTHPLHSLLLVIVGTLVAVTTVGPLGLWMGWTRHSEAPGNPL